MQVHQGHYHPGILLGQSPQQGHEPGRLLARELLVQQLVFVQNKDVTPLRLGPAQPGQEAPQSGERVLLELFRLRLLARIRRRPPEGEGDGMAQIGQG